jgi:PAS domain S-box-containing protein
MSCYRQADNSFVSPEITYRDLFKLNPQPMWVYDVETFKILDVNEAAIRHYGYSSEEFLQLTIKDLRPECDIHMLVAAVERVRKHDALYSTGIHRHKKKDGTVIYVAIQSNIIYINGRKAELVLSTDFTEKYKADEKFKAIFEHTRDAIIITDNDGICMDYNDAAVALFGYTKTELFRKSLFDILMFQADQVPQEVWARFLQGEILNGMMRLRHKRGNMIIGSFNAQPDILPGMHLCIITDITERIEKKKQLLESERRFKALVQEGADLIGIIDLQGNYQFVSESCLPILGFDPQKLIGQNAFNYIHPEDRFAVAELFGQLTKTRQIRTEPFRFLDAQDNYRWITTIATNLTNDPAVNGIVVNSRDITESVVKSRDLTLTNERYKLILNAANEAIYDWDIEQDKVEWGTGFKDIFGYDLDVYDNHLWSDNICDHDKERVLAEIQCAKWDASRDMHVTECSYIRCDKSVALVEHRIIFLRNSCGSAIRAVGSVRDITDYKQNLHRIRLQNEQLREIAWIQSHVVRAPLTRMMGLVELLKLGEYGDLGKEAVLDLVQETAAELDTVIKDIVSKADKVQSRHG